MRIACVGRNAADRLALQRFVEEAYEQCRSSVGHIAAAQVQPAGREEVLLNEAPGIVLVSSGFSVDEAYGLCRELRAVHAAVPVLILLAPENYSLRALRRLEGVSSEVLSTQDQPVRIIHKLLSFGAREQRTRQGKLISVAGVKGGAGATSIVSGLAHAAQALGRSAAVLDLSVSSVFAHYMGAPRRHSPDYAAALADGMAPDDALVQRCVVTAANGIPVMLPPSGGSEVRELWLRDPSRFEITLNMVEVLLEQYDFLFVDLAGAEGVLPFALNCRASARLLIAANDAASVHLLGTALGRAADHPGGGKIRIILNAMVERGLNAEDVLDFLCCCDSFEEDMFKTAVLPFDASARHWIGTGNSFYTEAGRHLQRALEKNLRLAAGEAVSGSEHPEKAGLFGRLKALTARTNLPRSAAVQALPEPQADPGRLAPKRSTLSPEALLGAAAPVSDVVCTPSGTGRGANNGESAGVFSLYQSPQLEDAAIGKNCN